MKFSEFYSDVRTYFVSCTVEYDRFRLCEGIKQKLVFLLRNKKVMVRLRYSNGLVKKLRDCYVLADFCSPRKRFSLISV